MFNSSPTRASSAVYANLNEQQEGTALELETPRSPVEPLQQPDLEEGTPPSYEESTGGTNINVSVTNGGSVTTTFVHCCPDGDETSVDELKAGLSAQLEKADTEGRKLRMLIFRGQILQSGKCISDYKLSDGDTLQLLTWAPEAAAAAAEAAAAAANPPPQSPSGGAGGRPPPEFVFEGFRHHFQVAAAAAQSPNAMILQEEVGRWSARVKVWTCMLLLIYSFRLLVSMSQSIDKQQQQKSSQMAFSFLGFWVAYIGLRAATRLNFPLARGYYYGQVTVAMCNLFLLAIGDPSVTPHERGADGKDHPVEASPSVLWISFAIHCIFWAYIVYGAYRFQRALGMWLQDGAPDHIIESQEEV